MRFVHDTKDDALVAAVFLGQLCPYADELLVAGSTLSDDSAVPASIVVLRTNMRGKELDWEKIDLPGR